MTVGIFASHGGEGGVLTMKASRSHSFLMVVLCVVSIIVMGCVATQPVSKSVVSKRAQMHMGTLVTLTVVATDRRVGDRAMQAGFDEVKRLEQLLSTWRSDSELSRVNAESGRLPVKVSQETLDLVVRSLEITQLTQGGFNIALGPAVEAWSVTEQAHIPGDHELQQLRPLVDWTNIRIDKEAGTIFLPLEGMRLDVGGIGKGYAADRAVEEMKRAGATGGVVALSGDIKTFGVLPYQNGFSVGIRHPREEGALMAILELKDEAISTAGDYERFFERGGVRYHHILDPQTLQPARMCQSVTIVAKEGMVADGLDTGVFVLGPEEGMALVERLPNVEAIIIDNEGTMMVSSGLHGRLHVP